MELQNKLNEIFYEPDKKPAKDANSVLALKTIEHQMNQFLKNKKGQKYERISLMKADTNNKELFNKSIDDEIAQKTKNKKWKSLPSYLKWKFVNVYFQKNNITDKAYIERVKKQLDNESIFKYDHVNQEVLEISDV